MRKQTNDAVAYPIPTATARAVNLASSNKAKSEKLWSDLSLPETMANQRADDISTANSVNQVLQDANIAAEILVSTILSPKDMVEPRLEIEWDADVLDGKTVPDEVTKLLKKHFSTVYNFESEMQTILRESLFEDGAYVTAFIPPNLIDEVIQHGATKLTPSSNIISLEGIDNHYDEVAMDLIDVSPSVYGEDDLASVMPEVTSDITLLRRPELKTKRRQNRIGNMYDLESYGADKQKKKTEDLTKFDWDVVKEERANSNPIPFKLSAESVIPISDPANKKRHMLYIVVIDPKTGQAISGQRDINYMHKLEERMQKLLDAESPENKFARIVGNSVNIRKEKKSADLNKLRTMYNETLQEHVRSAIGDEYGTSFEVNMPEEVYRMMLGRHLSNQETKFLVLPKEVVSYHAHNYNEHGVGIGLFEMTKLIASFRMILLIGDINAGMSNSSPLKKLLVTLDENMKDHQKVIEGLLHEFTECEMKRSAMGLTNPSEIAEAIKRNNYVIEINGGDKYPGVKMEVEDMARAVATSDDSLNEMLQRLHMWGLCVSPEQVNLALESDLATSIASNNLLTAKRAMGFQATFKDQSAEEIRKYCRLSAHLRNELGRLANNIDFEVLLNSLRVKLPEADTAKLETQYASYGTKGRFYEDAIRDRFSDDHMRDIVANISSEYEIPVDGIRAMITGWFKKSYLRSENMLPELAILDTKEGMKELIDMIRNDAELASDVFKSVSETVLKKSIKTDNALNKKREKLESGEDDDEVVTPTPEPEPNPEPVDDVEEAAPEESEETPPVPEDI